MVIRFCKGDKGRDTLVCVRDDGTSTWSKLTDRFIYHDLTHYVVETTLGFREAFYGLIAQGWDIETFTAVDPATGQRPQLPTEAIQAESFVVLFQSQSWSSVSNAEILALLEMACTANDTSTPHVAPEQIDTMRQRLRNCRQRWEQIPAGGALELPFPGAQLAVESEEEIASRRSA